MMSVLDIFLQFTERLPADRLPMVEAALAEIMASHSDRFDLSPTERAIVDQRVAEDVPAFSDDAVVTDLFGKPFSA